MMADYRVQDSVAIIELNSPPVNALGHNVRLHLDKYVKKALADKKVTCIVIAGKNNNFSAGADIKEFGGEKKRANSEDPDEMPHAAFYLGLRCLPNYLGPELQCLLKVKEDLTPWLTDTGNTIDAGNKPVVAAIQGVALGGGLEVALFCHYRIALKSARLGFPEVQIGILPGAAGTQRLPRVAGIPNALEMITTGNHVSAEKALGMGIIDKIVSGNIVEEGIKFALSVASKDLRQVCLRHRDVKFQGDIDNISEAALAKVRTKFNGYMAPVFCVKSVLNAAMLPYDAGVEKEAEYFRDLVVSSQAAAQRYSFFAERAISRWQLPSGGNYKTAKPVPMKTTGVIGAGTMGGGIALSLITSGFPCVLVEQNKEVKTVGVIGAGTMGGGIALSLITSGFPCVLVEQNKEFLDKGLNLMKAQLMGTVQRRKITAEQAKHYLSLLTSTTNFEDLKNVDLVIEAVYEDLKLKKEIFEKIDRICNPHAILCTNTSTLEIDLIAAATKRPEKVVGTHFFAPAYIMKLLENIYGTQTSAETVATVMKLGKAIKKVPVLVGSCTGFVANRMLANYSSEAQFLVEEGALPHEVDQVLSDFGMPMGTFEVGDLSGLDVGYRIKREAARAVGVTLTVDSRFFQGQRNCSLIERLVEKGRLGKKVGRGWYKYEKAGGSTPTVDPEVTAMIEEHCQKLGIERRSIGSQEILERMQYAMINEGFKILEDGKCSMPEEIDVIWLYGFTWPKYAGGPMYYASKIGLKKVYERICYYHKQHPYSMYWVPSPLLKKLSEADLPIERWGEVARGSKL